jgi:hypothetical protein
MLLSRVFLLVQIKWGGRGGNIEGMGGNTEPRKVKALYGKAHQNYRLRPDELGDVPVRVAIEIPFRKNSAE